MYETPIRTEALITRIRKTGVFDARLPNGKITCAHLSKALAADADPFEVGTMILLELTPYDFDTARIACRLEPSTTNEGPSPATTTPDGPKLPE